MRSLRVITWVECKKLSSTFHDKIYDKIFHKRPLYRTNTGCKILSWKNKKCPKTLILRAFARTGDERIEHSNTMPINRTNTAFLKNHDKIYDKIFWVNNSKDFCLLSSIDFLYILFMTASVSHPPIAMISASGIPNECAYEAK